MYLNLFKILGNYICIGKSNQFLEFVARLFQNISSEILTHIRHCALKASRRGRNVKVDCQTLPLKCGAEWKTWPSVCTKYWVVYFSIKYLIWYSNPKEMNSINLASLGLMKKWVFNDAYVAYLMAKTLYHMSNHCLPKVKWLRFWSLRYVYNLLYTS